MAKSDNIEVCPDYDNTGRWCLKIRKKKGKLTIDELTQILTDWEWNFYAVIIKAIPADGDQYFDDYDDPGDYIVAYYADEFWKGVSPDD